MLLATFKKKKVFFIFSERFASVFDLEYRHWRSYVRAIVGYGPPILE